MLTFIIIAPLIILTIVFFIFLSKEKKEKKELFHIMAHKLRASISVIKWYTELLLNKSVGDLNDKQKKYFNEIRKSSEKFNDIIDSLAPKK